MDFAVIDKETLCMCGVQGCGEAIGHHGELLQGIFEVEGAHLRRGLVSLPCCHFISRATFKANNRNRITVTPCHCQKARRAAELALHAFARIRTGGQLTIESNIPVGRGMGSSTADVVASILAVLDHLRIDAVCDRMMQLAISAETACDSTFFRQQAVLFAHRDGVVIEAFRRSLPPIDFISVDTMPDATVDTLDFEPARYFQSEIETFRPLRSLLRRAIDNADVHLLGRVATASTRINERFLPKPRLKEIQAIGARHGTVGTQVAHSGTVVGLLFDKTDERAAENMHLAARDLRELDLEPLIFCH